MKQATWRVGWYSKVVLTIIAVSLVGLLVRQASIKVKAEQEFDWIDKYIACYQPTKALTTKALITKFMEKMRYDCSNEVLMSYISKEYLEAE